MSHVRQQIRNKIVDLVTGLATTGSNVFKSRLYPLHDDNLPGLCVSTGIEEIDDEEGKVEGVQHRNLEIIVLACDKITAGLDDKLDTIATEVETAVFVDRFLGNLVQSLDLAVSEPEISDEMEQPVGSLALVFTVQYLTDEGTPETAL